MKYCPITKCPKRRGDDQVMCRDHWFKVPKNLRDKIWYEFQNNRGSEAHRAAVYAAIDHVNKLEMEATK